LERGGIWDSALSEYLDRKRAQPLWTLGDSDFHGAEQQLDAVVTWIYAQRADKAALVDAMARGRMVAVQGGGFPCLRVEEFALAAPGDQAGRVMCGETVRDPKATTVRFALSRSVPGLSVRLIRNGEVIFTTREGSFAFADSAFLAGHRQAYYRVEATGDGGIEVVTNPVFREK
jgi:hypothetical protein